MAWSGSWWPVACYAILLAACTAIAIYCGPETFEESITVDNTQRRRRHPGGGGACGPRSSVAQQLRILQSLWAMERRLAYEAEWPLQTQLAMIRDAGFDGVGVRFIDPVFVTGSHLLPARQRHDLAGAVLSDLMSTT